MDAKNAERLFRRIQMLFGRGRVSQVNDTGTVQTMQVQMSDLETSDNRIRMAEFGFTSNPPAGSDALVMSVAGDRGASAVIATNHQPSRPKGLQPGETMLFSQDGKYVYLTASGGISIFANGQPVNVSGATTVTITASTEIIADTPIFKCTGDIIDNCDTNEHTIADMRAISNEHTHPVPEVEGGGDTVQSDPPNQSM